MTKLLKALFILLLLPAAAQAQDTQNAPAPQEQTERPNVPEPVEMTHLYAPEHCDFQIGFPETPVIEEKCDGGESRDQCYEQVTFTQTFGLDATINVRVVCNTIGNDIKDRYTKDVMLATLHEMTKDKVVDIIQTTTHEDDKNRYRIAGLVAEGKVGLIPSIFIAQMWLGQTSAFSIEAEVVGDGYVESDALFRDILRSVLYKGKDADETEVQNAPTE